LSKLIIIRYPRSHLAPQGIKHSPPEKGVDPWTILNVLQSSNFSLIAGYKFEYPGKAIIQCINTEGDNDVVGSAEKTGLLEVSETELKVKYG
jgi:hypothetical protein